MKYAYSIKGRRAPCGFPGLYIIDAAVKRFAWKAIDLKYAADLIWICYPAIILTSLSAAQFLGVVLAVLWFLPAAGKRMKAWPPGLGWPVMIFSAWILIAALGAQASIKDINDMAGKWIYIPLLALAYAQRAESKRIWKAMLILAAAAIIQYPYFIHSYLYDGYARARALSGGSPNLGTNLMMAILILAPFLIYLRRRAKLLLGTALGLLSGALAITLNRAAILGTLAGLAWTIRKRPAILVAGLAAAMVLLLAFPQARLASRIYGALSLTYSGTAMERIRMWKSGLAMIRDRPLAGFTSKRRFKDEYWTKYRAAYTTEPRPPGHVHNSVIQVAIFHGIPGLGLFLWWFIVIFRRAWALRDFPVRAQDPHRGLLARAVFPLLLAVSINAQFDFIVVEGQRAIMFYSLAGLLMGCAQGLSATNLRPRPRSLRRKGRKPVASKT